MKTILQNTDCCYMILLKMYAQVAMLKGVKNEERG